MPKHKLTNFEIEGEPEEDEYEVEDIVDFKFIKGQPKYLVKWKGFTDEDNTWEPEDNMTNLPAFADKMVALKAAHQAAKAEKTQRKGKRGGEGRGNEHLASVGGAYGSGSRGNSKAAAASANANRNGGLLNDDLVAIMDVGTKRSARASASGGSDGGSGELVFKKLKGPLGHEKATPSSSDLVAGDLQSQLQNYASGGSNSVAGNGGNAVTGLLLSSANASGGSAGTASSGGNVGGDHDQQHEKGGGAAGNFNSKHKQQQHLQGSVAGSALSTQGVSTGSHGSHSAGQGKDEEDAVEVEDLLDYKPRFKKDYFLVRWKGEWEDSWEPRRNLLIVGDLMHKMNDLKMSYMRIYGPSEMEDEVFVTVQSIRISGAATLSAVVIEMTRDTESRSLLPLQEVRRKWPQQLLDFLLSRLRLRSAIDVADDKITSAQSVTLK